MSAALRARNSAIRRRLPAALAGASLVCVIAPAAKLAAQAPGAPATIAPAAIPEIVVTAPKAKSAAKPRRSAARRSLAAPPITAQASANPGVGAGDGGAQAPLQEVPA